MNVNIRNRFIEFFVIYISALLIGYFFIGSNIFNYYSNSLVITTFGLVGSIFLIVYKRKIKREIYFTAIILFTANVTFLGRPFTFTYLLRDALFFVSLYGAIIIYVKFLKKYFYSPLFIRALVLALFYGILNVIATLILLIIYDSAEIAPLQAMFINAKHGMIIGLGIGIGMDLYKKLPIEYTLSEIREQK